MQSRAVRNLGGQEGFQNGLLQAAKQTQPGDISAQRQKEADYVLPMSPPPPSCSPLTDGGVTDLQAKSPRYSPIRKQDAV